MNYLNNYLKESKYNQFFTQNDFEEIEKNKIDLFDYEKLDKELKFYILISGYLDLYYPDKNGKNHLVGRLYAKDFQINGILMYLKHEYNNLNNPLIKISKGARIAKINEEKIKFLLDKADFLKFVLARKLKYNERLVQENYYRSIFSIDEYLAYILVIHSENKKYFVDNYSNFAKLLKCNRTTLYRAFDRLIENKLIEKKGDMIEIISYENLRKLFDDYL